jgi:cobyrinic acid a,c-diamide synthase
MVLPFGRTRLAKAIIVAAPHSGSGKTLVTLGLLRALRNRGVKVTSFKVGPDYIDPQFHAAASGRECMNLDLWAMGKEHCAWLLDTHSRDAEVAVIEGVMGLFDGPEGAPGSTADLAAALGLPVLLVIDVAHQAQSVAALVSGFHKFRPDVEIAGLFLNRVKSDRHAALLEHALQPAGIAIVGQMRQVDSLSLPSRHLGLVQAVENQSLESILESAASGVARETVLDTILHIARKSANHLHSASLALTPLGQTVAVARDEAFSFAYPHLLNGWRAMGAELSFFSPLADEAPAPSAAAIFLPGGYPELHAGKLASNSRFKEGLRQFAGLIYGECGGYMVLGESLADATGVAYPMAGLLPLETSFKERKLHLGYRQLLPLSAPWSTKLRGHEFHYATIVREGEGDKLFDAATANGTSLPKMGLRRGNVMGSFAHVISMAHKLS